MLNNDDLQLQGSIKNGVECAAGKVQHAVTAARDHVPGDNMVSKDICVAITYAEDATRFQLGVVGGITREVVGLTDTLGELAATAVETQFSLKVSAEYGQTILHGAPDAATATSDYLESVVHDLSRIGGDLAFVADAGQD